MVSIIIDNREKGLKDLVNVPFEEKNLVHGDVQLVYNGTVLAVLERKTVQDLCASIKDGRYKNQKAAMLEAYPPGTIYYVLEGGFDYSETDTTHFGIAKKALVSCMINSMLRDNIKVFVTNSIQETAGLVDSIYARVSENPGKYSGTVQAVAQVIKPKNKDMTPKKMFELQLCQVPGVSSKTAKAFSSRYESMARFVGSLSGMSAHEKAKALKEITLDNNNRVSSLVVKNIVSLLFGEDV